MGVVARVLKCQYNSGGGGGVGQSYAMGRRSTTTVQQLVRLLDCETKARRAVVGTKRASKQRAQAEDAGALLGLFATAARESHPGHWRRLSIALPSAHIHRHHTVTLYTARRVADELPSPPLPSARRLDRAASGRALAALLAPSDNCQLATQQPAIGAFPTLQSYTLPLGLCTRCTSPILTRTGQVWPDTHKPRSQLCACVLGCLATKKMRLRETNR